MIKEDIKGWFIYATSSNDNIAYCDLYSSNLYGAFNRVVERILEDPKIGVNFTYTIVQSPF